MFAISNPSRTGRADIKSRRAPASFTGFVVSRLVFAIVLCFATMPMFAQTGGEAGIQGTVTDPTGAAIPHATVIATENATGNKSTRETTGEGLYTISPILPGTYTVSVKAPGFREFVQNNLAINALVLTPLNVTLTVGAESSTVTVDVAPPAIETTNATLGLTIEKTTYEELPLTMNNAQRDPTAFAALAPGSQGGARVPIVGGTGNYLGQLYLDGLPAQTINQQGDNRVVSETLSVEAVDQFQVVTSAPPAEYTGAGSSNYTMKSGGNQYHGQISDYIKNTAFDAWGFTVKAQTIKDASGNVLPAPKPVDHQNELSVSFGGHVPFVKRLYFFVAYDKFHNRSVQNPQAFNIPSALERAGDFTELNCAAGSSGCFGTGLTGTAAPNTPFLYDPTTSSCTGNTCTRQPFMGLKNGVPTYNVIPSSYISPIAKGMQSFLPAVSNANTLAANYTAGQTGGFDNNLFDYRVDFNISDRHRISTVGALGNVVYLNNFAVPFLPIPYVGGTYADIHPKVFDVEDAYTINNSMVNQLKYGFVRFAQPQRAATDGLSQYYPAAFGITNLPAAGQAVTEFPGAAFGTTTKFGTALTGFTANSGGAVTQSVTPNNYTLLDNFQWVKGKHAMTFGISMQWEQINTSAPKGPTGLLQLSYNAFDTANYVGTSLSTATTGYAYASYLLGAVGGTPTLGLQPVSETGGRYHPISPYAEDTWRVNSKVTVDAGLRWDYLPPFHEVKDHWSFLNPNQTNAATGTAGDIQLAGNYGGSGVSCGCRTPVQTYWKNWGPRLGVTFSPDPKTVFRIGVGHVFSQAGGVGGRGGNSGGAGQLGFNVTATGPAESTTGISAGPSFYLNNSPAFASAGIANTSLFGAGYAYPTAPTLGPSTQVLNTGNYLNGAGAFVTAGAVTYADPVISGRAPDFTFYNFGFQHAFTSALVLAVNYVGNQSHHLINATNSGTGNPRGYWTNQLDPKYLAAFGSQTDTTGTLPLLNAPATAVNVAKAQTILPGVNIPMFFQNAAAVKSTATIAQGLVAFPQYSGVTDIWGTNVGNFSYNSLQVTLQQRFSHGLTFNANYTWSKNIGDDGTFRSGYNIPAAAIDGGTHDWHQDRIDRGTTLVSTPHAIHAYYVYKLPFGAGRLGGSNAISRTLLSGWQTSGIYTYASGTVAAVTYAGCTTPLQGQCMPSINPAFTGSSARIGGSFGSGPGGRSACNLAGFSSSKCATGAVSYFDSKGFTTPAIVSPAGVAKINLIGNAPRTGALGLKNPGAQNIDMSLARVIFLPREMNVKLEASATNVWNHTIFGSPNAVYGSATFGQISTVTNKPRQFQVSAHFNF
jgi:hypothetical protein